MFDRIEADYEVLGQIANQFDAHSAQIAQTLQSVQARMEVLRAGGWIGRGSDSFYAEMQGEVLPAVQRLNQALQLAGQTTRQMSGLIQQSEEEACGPFRDFSV